MTTSRHTLPELFDKALALAGTHTREDIAEGIKVGRYQYWGDDRCCLVTEIHDFPQCRKLHLFIAAGDLDRLLEHYLPVVTRFAADNGCVSLTSVSRKGFLRRFPAHGFKPKCITFEMEIAP